MPSCPNLSNVLNLLIAMEILGGGLRTVVPAVLYHHAGFEAAPQQMIVSFLRGLYFPSGKTQIVPRARAKDLAPAL